MAAVQQYVSGVSTKDTARMRAVVDPGARYDLALLDGADAHTVRSGSIESTFPTVASRAGLVAARIWRPVVQVHEDIASVWTPYAVTVDGIYGWCGTDHFTVLRRASGWRISSVTYTRQTTGCEVWASRSGRPASR